MEGKENPQENDNKPEKFQDNEEKTFVTGVGRHLEFHFYYCFRRRLTHTFCINMAIICGLAFKLFFIWKRLLSTEIKWSVLGLGYE